MSERKQQIHTMETAKGKYVIFRDYAAGKPNRWTVVKLNAVAPKYVGRELTLAQAWGGV